VGVIAAAEGGAPVVKGVEVEVIPGRHFGIRSAVTIDATGSGVLSELAGCTVMYGREGRGEFDEPSAPPEADDKVQHCTWMYFAQRTGAGKPLETHKLEAGGGVAILHGIAPRGQEEEWDAKAPERELDADPGLYLFWGCSIACRDTRDPVELARTHTEALAVMERDHALLREHGYAIYLAPRIGVRECRRILCEYVITENHLREGEFPDDTIAACDYGLDVWDEKEDYELGLSVARYGIPYRALVPLGVDGLLVAGKCISGTHIAMSSHRVMPIAGKTGQAAGAAAALSAEQGVQPRELDARKLREVLRRRDQHVQLTLDEG
jgi:hypothetical protein